MRNNRLNYIIVGSFVIVSLIGLLLSVAMLTGRTGATDRYFAVYSNVNGVKYGTQVLHEGFPVGQVERIVPVEQDGRTRFRVEFSVQQGWRIPDNSVAQIAASGLLAASTVDIRAGNSRSALAPGSEVKASEAANLMDAMASIAVQMGALGEELNATVPQIARDLAAFAGHLNEGGQSFRDLLGGENQQRVASTLQNIDSVSTDLARLVTDLHQTRQQFDRLLNDSHDLVAQNRPAIEQSMDNLRHVTDVLARDIDSVSHNLDRSSRNLYEFSRQIRQNPGALISSRPPQDEAAR
ncbi:MAG: MlaD family protein [Chromatiales bacterium]|jgi:phospholipid/cholesterol/gamma-HCH transport system substrate-binding protein|nr:MlaD family protein [Chromatiales bacterium]MDX9766797.1 MlaD family protein [Ectothiorhodospiraceae bacterium]